MRLNGDSAGADRCGSSRKFLYQPVIEKFLQIVVERARSQPILPFSLAGDLLHDAVAVTVFRGKR